MQETAAQFVLVRVTGLAIDPFTNMPIVVLKNDDGTIALPIWIGLIEASSIATELEHVEFSRPMTHDLFRECLTAFEIGITRVEVFDLVDNTFYARIVMAQHGREVSLDARPSDALALALRTKSAVFVSHKVIEKAREIDLTKRYEGQDTESETWAEILENLSPDDFGKYKM